MVNGSFIRLLRVPLSVRNGLKVGVKRLNYIILRRTLDGNKKIVLSGIYIKHFVFSVSAEVFFLSA